MQPMLYDFGHCAVKESGTGKQNVKFLRKKTRWALCKYTRSDHALVNPLGRILLQVRFQSIANPCGICGVFVSTGTEFSPGTLVSHCQYQCLDAEY
jgi:hypothetical protein